MTIVSPSTVEVLPLICCESWVNVFNAARRVQRGAAAFLYPIKLPRLSFSGGAPLVCIRGLMVNFSARHRVLAIAAGHVVATVALIVAYPSLGAPAGLFGLLAVLGGALVFGMRGGLASAGVQTLLNALVMQWALSPVVPFNVAALVGVLAYFLFAAALGNQRDLSRKLRTELELNEHLRVRERETLAAIPDVMLRIAPDDQCFVQGAPMDGGVDALFEIVLGRPLTHEQRTAIVERVRSVRERAVGESVTLEATGAIHDVRFLPTADASVLVVLRDVTEQTRLLRRLTAAENLASLGTLAAGLAHEINNPLTYVIASIGTAAQCLAEGHTGAGPELDAALEGCWRIRDLVRSILATSAARHDAVEPVVVTEVVESALALVRHQVQHRATLEWVPELVPGALAHRTKLMQVVVNLVVNAAQSFTDPRTPEHWIRVRAYAESPWVCIEVKDNGAGMDETTRSRAIEPFFTTKDPGQGTGLGLFLCSSIVESLGGTLDIKSEAGAGTCVTVKLPMADESPSSRVTTLEKPLVLSQIPRRFSAVVVDDEPQIRRALCRVLSKTYDVKECGSGRELLQQIVSGARFDVILCDISMPEMTGIELFDELRRGFPDLAERVLFLTGGATSESARRFISKHSDRVINKPFNFREVEVAVRGMARRPMPIANSAAPSVPSLRR